MKRVLWAVGGFGETRVEVSWGAGGLGNAWPAARAVESMERKHAHLGGELVGGA